MPSSRPWQLRLTGWFPSRRSRRVFGPVSLFLELNMADMPLPNWKVTMFFEDGAVSYGWTETIYILAGDTSTVPNSVANALVEPRLAFLPTTHYMIAARLSQEGVRGDASGLAGAPAPGALDVSMRTLVDRWSCLLLQKASGDRKSHGHSFCHAVPRDFFTAGDNYDDGNASDTEVKAYCALLASGPYCMKAKRLGEVSFPAITACAPFKKTEHKVGRPFGLRHGRASRV